MSIIQLKGSVDIGGTDFSSVISSAVITRTRETVSVPATFATGRTEEKAGALRQTLTLNFYSEMAATSFWADLYDAIDTDSAELTFEILFDEGAVGVDNPSFSGTFVVTELDTGGTAGELREQSKSFPIVGAITKATA